MNKLVFAGVATTTLMLIAPAANASDSFAMGQSGLSGKTLSDLSQSADGAKSMGMRPMGGMRTPRMGGMRAPRMGGRSMAYHGPRGRWHGGRNAPGGYKSYRRPYRGFILPSYWVNPSFFIGSYSSYGLRAPTYGYNWSRYYDDAVLTDNRGYVYDTVTNVPWGTPVNHTPVTYTQPAYSPALSADQSVYQGYDLPANSATESGTYQGQWTGAYVDPQGQTYRGQWEGKYVNQEGQVYEGTYRGTSVGAPVYANGNGNGGNYGYTNTPPAAPVPPAIQAPVAAPAPVAPGAPYAGAPYQPMQTSYAAPNGYESYERCLKGRGVKGGVIGAVIGAVAGNRIAGRGNRLAGSLIGGGIGGLAGLGIEKALDKCERFLPEPPRPVTGGGYPHPHPPIGHYPQQPYGYGWYYQQQAPVTTVTIIPGNTVTTTTTTEEVIYENVYTSVPRKGKGLRRPVVTKKKCHC